MADQLATPADLAAALQQDLDLSTATVWIEAATAVVQAAAGGQRIIEVVDDEVTVDLDGPGGPLWLDLPQRPVTAVSTVLIGASAVTDYRVQTSRARLWRADGWRSTLVASAWAPTTVTVTYTHGIPAGDQRLQLARGAVIGLARAGYANAAGVTQERIDDYSVAYEAVAARLEASPALRGQLLRYYGRPGGSVRLAG